MSYCPVERNVEIGRKLRLLVFSAFTTGDHGQCCSLTKNFREMLIMKILSLHGSKFDTKRMVLAAMLIALQIILEKLSIGDPAVLKIDLGLLPRH